MRVKKLAMHIINLYGEKVCIKKKRDKVARTLGELIYIAKRKAKLYRGFLV